MPYDFYLIGGFFLLCWGLLLIAASRVDFQRSYFGGALFLMGAGLIFTAFYMVDFDIGFRDCLESLFRVLAWFKYL